MRALIVLVLLAALGWSVWWMIGSGVQEQAVRDWTKARQSEGWQVDIGSFEVKGFPNRFDTTLDTILIDSGSWGWQGERFTLFALSYKPNHIIARWPDRHELSTPWGTVAILNDLMQASIVVEPSPDLSLSEFRLETEHATLTHQDSATEVDAVNMAVRTMRSDPRGYEVFLRGRDIMLSPALRTQTRIADPVTLIEFHLITQLDRPIDRHLPGAGLPNLTHLTIVESALDWGDIRLTMSGDLSINDRGQPEGQINIESRDIRSVLSVLTATGQVTEAQRLQWQIALQLLAPQQQDSPLAFSVQLRDGNMFLGPIRLGPAPVLRWNAD